MVLWILQEFARFRRRLSGRIRILPTSLPFQFILNRSLAKYPKYYSTALNRQAALVRLTDRRPIGVSPTHFSRVGAVGSPFALYADNRLGQPHTEGEVLRR